VRAQNRRIVTSRSVTGDERGQRFRRLFEEEFASNARDDRLERAARAVGEDRTTRRVCLERNQAIVFFRRDDDRTRSAHHRLQCVVAERSEKFGPRPGCGTFERRFGRADADDLQLDIRLRAGRNRDLDAFVRQ